MTQQPNRSRQLGVHRRVSIVAITALLLGCGTVSPTTPSDSLIGWTSYKLPGKRATTYARAYKDGRSAWHADARASASLLRQPVHGHVAGAAIAEFSWWVGDTIAGADLSRAEAADAPARIVLAFGGDTARLSHRNRTQFQLIEFLTGEPPPYATLMYVWDNVAPLETVLVNPRSDRIREIVIESGRSSLRQWRDHRRNLAADFRRAFGEDPGPLIGVALMTDADNTGGSAEAWYGELVLR